MIETWKGEYQGFVRKIGGSGKIYYLHKIGGNAGVETFSSFVLPDALKDAQGLQVTIPIIRLEEGYCNFDPSRQVEVEAPTIKEAKETPAIKTPEEGLRGCLRIANSLITEAMSNDGQPYSISAYERADLVIRLAITMWIQKR